MFQYGMRRGQSGEVKQVRFENIYTTNLQSKQSQINARFYLLSNTSQSPINPLYQLPSSTTW